MKIQKESYEKSRMFETSAVGTSLIAASLVLVARNKK